MNNMKTKLLNVYHYKVESFNELKHKMAMKHFHPRLDASTTRHCLPTTQVPWPLYRFVAPQLLKYIHVACRKWRRMEMIQRNSLNMPQQTFA
jgi:hypothetical protein